MELKDRDFAEALVDLEEQINFLADENFDNETIFLIRFKNLLLETVNSYDWVTNPKLRKIVNSIIDHDWME